MGPVARGPWGPGPLGTWAHGAHGVHGSHSANGAHGAWGLILPPRDSGPPYLELAPIYCNRSRSSLL